MIETKGRFTISRVHTNKIERPDYIKVEIINDETGRIVVLAELELTDFAMAITGLGRVAAELTIYNKTINQA